MSDRELQPSSSTSTAVPEFLDQFDTGALNFEHWVPHYLPHWTTPERSAARYEVTDDGLTLRIDADQPAWRIEDGPMRVSNVQSGSWSGPAGSARGQHRHRPDLVVTSPQPTRRLYTPTGGRVEATLRASPDPTTMLAFWLVGFEEESAEDCGEICVAELFGNAISASKSTINVGVKAHHDPRLRDDMIPIVRPINAADWHTYAAAWDDDHIDFFIDDKQVHQVAQVLAYPMQLMLDLFEFPTDGPRDSHSYPKGGHVRFVKGARC